MVTIIVAAALDGAIGKEGDLLWHLSGDLKRFRRMTTGHAVLMGRKTWESLPRRPLPERLNVVVTSDRNYRAPGAVTVHSPEEGFAACGDHDVYVIGGDSIYRQTMDKADAVDLTLVEATFPDADAFFPMPDEKTWERTCESEPMTDPKSGLSYRHITLRRRSDAHSDTE